MEKYLYFAYGNNLNIDQMKMRCPDSVEVSSAVLKNWQLAERTFADIEIAEGQCVNGALYEVSLDDLRALDLYEGYPDFYTRLQVTVCDSSGRCRKAIVYAMTEENKKRCNARSYSDSYRKTCSEGAEAWGIPNAFAASPKRSTQEEKKR